MTQPTGTIWRYMDFPRFVSMLATSSLWFAKAAGLDDTFEAFCKVTPIEAPRMNDFPDSPTGGKIISSGSVIENLFRSSAAESCENAREHLYVNCWCAEVTESMAMWQVFGSGRCGIAIRSSTSRFKEAARFDVDMRTHCRFDNVKYHDDIEAAPDLVRDFTKGSIPIGSNLWGNDVGTRLHKRSAYRYENEWRAAMYQEIRRESNGITVTFDLHALIEEVLVAPRAEQFFLESVAAVMHKFELSTPLRRSSLLDRTPQKPEEKHKLASVLSRPAF